MKIAIAQLNPTVGDLDGNARAILAAAQKASEAGARLLLTPELSLCGYPPRDLLLNPNFARAMSDRAREVAAKLPPQLAVLAGIPEVNPHAKECGQKPLHNSVVLLEDGQIRRTFHKRLLPTYEVFDENRYFEPGGESDYFALQCGSRVLKIGATICEDLWNDESFWAQRNYKVNPLAELQAKGVDLVVNLSASPYSASKQQLREAMLAHSARHYRVPIVYANQVGGNDDLLFDGQSVAFDRSGNLVSRAAAFETDLTFVGFESGDLLPGYVTPLASCEEAEIWQALTMGVRDYVRKCGFTQALLGLSGGIDSSLVAAIAADALGKENVLAVLMPSPYSSASSLDDAYELVANLGIASAEIPISGTMGAYETALDPLFAGTDFGVAEENLQSRIRGNLLMAISNKFNYILLSTGNKSEMAVGYCTLYGDMNGGLAVIADVPKTRVYDLCRWRNRQDIVIPENVLSKPPSAELKPDQKDEDSLPAYDVLDEILERLLHRHQTVVEIVAAGHDRDTVEKVVKLLARAEFKRRQAPPGLKITDRAFGTGWRMPIASRTTGWNQ